MDLVGVWMNASELIKITFKKEQFCSVYFKLKTVWGTQGLR